MPYEQRQQRFVYTRKKKPPAKPRPPRTHGSLTQTELPETERYGLLLGFMGSSWTTRLVHKFRRNLEARVAELTEGPIPLEQIDLINRAARAEVTARLCERLIAEIVKEERAGGGGGGLSVSEKLELRKQKFTFACEARRAAGERSGCIQRLLRTKAADAATSGDPWGAAESDLGADIDAEA